MFQSIKKYYKIWVRSFEVDGHNSRWSDVHDCVRQGMVVQLRDVVPHLVGTQCIAHRGALAVKDANDKFLCLRFIYIAVNKLYEWMR